MTTKSVKFFGTVAIALSVVAMLAVSGTALAREAKRTRGAHAPRVSQPHTRTTDVSALKTGTPAAIP